MAPGRHARSVRPDRRKSGHSLSHWIPGSDRGRHHMEPPETLTRI